jgi:protein-S-isoprenylcysteine O-methyltransferase Ste14
MLCRLDREVPMTDSNTPALERSGFFLPPPFVYLAGIIAGYLLQRVSPLPLPPAGLSRALGWLCIAAWALIALPALAAFFRARTSMIPLTESRVLVQTGLYRFTRNPMYLGLAFLQAGVGLLWGQPWILIMLVPVILVIQSFTVAWEERYLERRFGDEYRAYRARVRRWI